MKTETWRATRTRTAQLVPRKLLTALERYYVPLETLLTMLRYEEAKRKTTGNQEASSSVAGGRTQGEGCWCGTAVVQESITGNVWRRSEARPSDRVRR